MSRPVIGICTAVERAAWGAWEVVCNLSPRSYSLAVQAAGGLALLLPPGRRLAEQPGELLDLLDGLMLAGGSDVDPGSYGARPHPETRGSWPERDRFELALAYAALERDMPVLGICRGMQMLNVACGGTLEQHLADVATPPPHAGSLLRTTTCACRTRASRPGPSAPRRPRSSPTTIRASTSWATGSCRVGWRGRHRRGDRAARQAVRAGVLWHPEEDERSRVIGSLVEAARRYRGAPA